MYSKIYYFISKHIVFSLALDWLLTLSQLILLHLKR